MRPDREKKVYVLHPYLLAGLGEGKNVKMSLCLTNHHATMPHLLLNYIPRHEGVLGSGGIAPCNLILSTR